MPMSPMGLLRIGAHLKQKGHNVRLVDGAVVPNYYLAKCSIKDVYQGYPFVDYRPCGSAEQYEREGMLKPVRYFGKPLAAIKKEMYEAFGGQQPDQIWVGSHLTYYYETSWELVAIAKEMFPKATVLLGGIYPTLAPEHASRSGADIVYKGEIPDLEGVMPDYSLLDYDSNIKMFKSSRGCKVNPPCAFCLPPDEEVFTSNGFKAISDIKIGDYVATEDGNFEKVTHLFKREYDGTMVTISCKNSPLPVRMTSNHKIMTKRGIVEAGNLLPGDQVEIHLPGTQEWKGWKLPEFSHLKKPIKRDIYPSMDAAYLAGVYAAEGSLHFSRGVPASVSWTFNRDEIQLMSKVSKCVENVFGRPVRKPSDTGTAIQLYFGSKQVATLFQDEFGHGALNKRIPQLILESEPEILREFIKGLWDGDGSVFATKEGKYRACLTSQSKQLAFQTFIALRKLGFKSSLNRHQRKNSNIDGREIKYNGPTYQVLLHGYESVSRFCSDVLDINPNFPEPKVPRKEDLDDLSWIEVRYVEKEHYSGLVHNIEVSPTHRYQTSSFIVQNCAVPFMEKKFSPMDVDATFNWIKEEFDRGTRHFIMWSSQLLMPPRTFKEFCYKVIESGMPEKGLKISASEGIQPSLFKDDVAEVMRAAGFDDVNIPLEAIESDRIEEYHKPSSMNDVDRSIDLAFKHGFRSIKAFIMTATPQQSAEEIVEAVVYCWARGVRTSMMAFTPVPGSEMFDNSEEFQSRPLELLNPFLWPAAHEELTCKELEEIIGIANKRFDLWALTGRTKSRIDTMFEHYCHKYNLFKDRAYFLNSATVK